MRLNYKILWFEDDEDVIKEDPGPAIYDFLQDLGFQLDVVHRLNGEDLNQLIQHHDYDLIVTDLNLGEHETGAVLIDHIRDGKVLTEVLLYSANATEINAIVEEKGWIERASFCVGIANLKNKLKEIISLTVKKNQDVNNVRGLVMAETIDLEHKIESIMLKYFDATEGILDDDKQKLLENIHNKKVEKYEADIKVIKAISFTEIRKLIESDILTASNSFDAINSILKSKLKSLNAEISSGKLKGEEKEEKIALKNELDIIKEELQNFRTEILKIRNTLAHVKEEVGEDGISFLTSLNNDGTTIRFDSAKYIEIRKNLWKHNQNLDKILGHIS